MQRLLLVFLSTESTAGTSVLSKYSTSGLLNESQVDIVSSKETETPSDLEGETSIELETAVASVLEKAVTLLGAIAFVVSTSSNVVVLVVVKLVLRVLAGELFLALTALVAQGTCKFVIPFGKASESWLIIGKISKGYRYSTMELGSIDKI